MLGSYVPLSSSSILLDPIPRIGCKVACRLLFIIIPSSRSPRIRGRRGRVGIVLLEVEFGLLLPIARSRSPTIWGRGGIQGGTKPGKVGVSRLSLGITPLLDGSMLKVGCRVQLCVDVCWLCILFWTGMILILVIMLLCGIGEWLIALVTKCLGRGEVGLKVSESDRCGEILMQKARRPMEGVLVLRENDGSISETARGCSSVGQVGV